MRKTTTACALIALALPACGSSDHDPVPGSISSTGTVRLPLVAASPLGNVYRLDPASFTVIGSGAPQLFDGGGVDVLLIDLSPDSYKMTLEPGWVLSLIDGATNPPVDAELRSPNPQLFDILDGLRTDIVYRFGIGADTVTIGTGQARVSIDVTEDCVPTTWFLDADGDGFGGSSTVAACKQPAGYVADGGDCDDANPAVNPGATEICNGGDDDCDGASDGPTACTRRVFVTSTQTNGNLGGLAGGDATCAARANLGGLSGTWVAWLSTNSVNARNRLNPNAGPFVRLDGVTIANSVGDLTDGSIAAPILINELMGTTPLDVWTGTRANGLSDINFNCQDWTNLGMTARRGNANGVSAVWTEAATSTCGLMHSLYCFEQ